MIAPALHFIELVLNGSAEGIFINTHDQVLQRFLGRGHLCGHFFWVNRTSQDRGLGSWCPFRSPLCAQAIRLCPQDALLTRRLLGNANLTAHAVGLGKFPPILGQGGALSA
ncbi:hypothetical protein XH80_17960 [Bradyrhizobium sp. CCBAU 45384]|nr:hypothetical protein [Bradyrhizobium sp. CCBAU 45384]